VTDRTAEPPTNPGGTIFVSELPRDTPVEGAQMLASQIEAHLCQKHAAVAYGPGPGQRSAPLHPKWVGRSALSGMRRHQPGAVVYMPASGLTVAAVLRALLIWVSVRPRHFSVLVAQFHAGRGTLAALRLLGPLGWAWAVCNREQQKHLSQVAGIRAAVVVPRISATKLSSRSRADARAVLGLPAEGRIYLHVGHARRGRNLNALASLASDGHLVVVLSGAFNEEAGAVPEGPRITIVRGYVPSLADYYRAADVYVFPIADVGSVIGVPMSIVEALANELPVVAVRSPMVERWSKTNGVLLVDRPVDVPDAARRAHELHVPASIVPSVSQCGGDLVTCGGKA
jgi:hypothetical protein